MLFFLYTLLCLMIKLLSLTQKNILDILTKTKAFYLSTSYHLLTRLFLPSAFKACASVDHLAEQNAVNISCYSIKIATKMARNRPGRFSIFGVSREERRESIMSGAIGIEISAHVSRARVASKQRRADARRRARDCLSANKRQNGRAIVAHRNFKCDLFCGNERRSAAVRPRAARRDNVAVVASSQPRITTMRMFLPSHWQPMASTCVAHLQCVCSPRLFAYRGQLTADRDQTFSSSTDALMIHRWYIDETP